MADEGMLEYLLSLLTPQEADAAQAGGRAPQVDPMAQQQARQQQFMQQQMLRQQMAQQAAQNDPLKQAQLQIRQNQLQRSQREAQQRGQSMGDILSGASSQPQAQPGQMNAPQQDLQLPQDMSVRGQMPNGTPFIGNVLPPGATGPGADAFNQERARRQQLQQQRQAQMPQQTGTPDNGYREAQRMQVISDLVGRKVPESEAIRQADRMFPELSSTQVELDKQRQLKQMAAAEAATKPLTPDQTAKLWKFNPKTGRAEPYMSVEPISGNDAIRQGYRSVNPQQMIDAQKASDAVNLQFTLLKGAVEAAKHKSLPDLALGMATMGGWDNTGPNLMAAIHDFALQWDQLIGGVRAAASPMFLAAMKARLPQLLETDKLKEQKIRLLEPSVRVLQEEKLRSLMGLPPDPRIHQSMISALRGLGLPADMVNKFVYESGRVPNAPDPTTDAIPGVSQGGPVNQLPSVELGGVRYIKEGPGKYRLPQDGE